MEGCKIFVEVHCEEVEISDSSISSDRIMLQHIVEVSCCFCCNGSNLFVAARVSWYKQNWYSRNLSNLLVMLAVEQSSGLTYSVDVTNASFAI